MKDRYLAIDFGYMAKFKHGASTLRSLTLPARHGSLCVDKALENFHCPAGPNGIAGQGHSLSRTRHTPGGDQSGGGVGQDEVQSCTVASFEHLANNAGARLRAAGMKLGG